MKAKELIKLNNEKRDYLNEENLNDYEDMLVYIRLASTKSEQQTEEILLELLDHALLAQDEGKTIKDVFGNDLKAYSQDVIDEIPEETKKKQFRFAFRMIFLFLAVVSFYHGIINSGLHYIFGLFENSSTFYLGSSITIVIIDSLIVLALIIIVIKWLKASAFQEKKKSSKMEFFQLWIIITIPFGIFLCVIYFMPTFGLEFILPTLLFIPIGLVLYGISYLLKD